MAKEKLIKSKQRVKEHAEVFTPKHIVKQMCDIMDENAEEKPIQNKDATVLEPACGNGNFLVEILERRIALAESRNDVVRSLTTLYGVDIMPDNIAEAKARLLKICKEYDDNEQFLTVCQYVMDKNIQVGDTLDHPEDIIITQFIPVIGGIYSEKTYTLKELGWEGRPKKKTRKKPLTK